MAVPDLVTRILRAPRSFLYGAYDSLRTGFVIQLPGMGTSELGSFLRALGDRNFANGNVKSWLGCLVIGAAIPSVPERACTLQN